MPEPEVPLSTPLEEPAAVTLAEDSGGFAAVEARTQRQIVVRRFLDNRLAVVSLVVLVLVVIGAFAGQQLWHYKYDDLTGDYYAAPSLKHPFGTDSASHDELALIVRGAQASLIVAFLVAFIAVALGTLVGAVAGYFGGWVDAVLMRICDLILTLPVLAIAIVIGRNLSNVHFLNQKVLLALMLGLLSWPQLARVIRAQVLSLKEREFVEAAEALGAPSGWIIRRHLIPNVIGSIIVNATIYIAVAVLAETAISYLGFGIRAPDTSLGLLISASVSAATEHPWVFYFPGAVIIVIALTVNFVGDGLRDAFDPQNTRVRA